MTGVCIYDVATIWVFLLYIKPSVNELVRLPDFAEVPIIAEDFIKDHGGVYSGTLINY